MTCRIVAFRPAKRPAFAARKPTFIAFQILRLSLTGAVGGNGTTGALTGSMTMPADHPLNPYRHRYNPAHLTGYEITRDITLTFAAEDPDPVNAMLGLADSVGDNELVGTYREVISGVSLEPIAVAGFFRLFRRSETAPLPGCD